MKDEIQSKFVPFTCEMMAMSIDTSQIGCVDPSSLKSTPPCASCGDLITDHVIYRVLRHFWHGECLRCSLCDVVLTDKCYASDEHETQLLCQNDFFRLYGGRCAGCGGGLSPSSVVRRAHDNVYHPECYRCVLCDVMIVTGQEFYLMSDNRLLCKYDYECAKQTARRRRSSERCASVEQNNTLEATPGAKISKQAFHTAFASYASPGGCNSGYPPPDQNSPPSCQYSSMSSAPGHVYHITPEDSCLGSVQGILPPPPLILPATPSSCDLSDMSILSNSSHDLTDLL